MKFTDVDADDQAMTNNLTTSALVLLSLAVMLCTFLAQDTLRRRYKQQQQQPSRPARGRKLSGPWSLPLIGYLPMLGRLPFVTMCNLSRRYGQVYRIRMGSRDAVIINGVDALREALVHQGDVFAGRPHFMSFQVFSQGKSMAFQTYDAAWKVHRRLAVRALALFVNNKQYPLDDLVAEHAQLLTAELCSTPSGVLCDPRPAIETTVGNIIFRICFGFHGDCVADHTCRDMVSTLTEARLEMNTVMNADVLPWTAPIVSRSIAKFETKLRHFGALADAKLCELETEYVKGRSACAAHALMDAWNDMQSTRDDDVNNGEQYSRTDATGSVQVDRARVVHTVQDFIGAGTDTVVNFLHWAIAYMAKYPAVQERARAEVRAFIGSAESISRWSNRAALPYVEACIWEIMRHGAISPLTIPHETLRDTTLSGFHIPAGTLVFGNLYSTGRNETVFSNPELFYPERFLAPDGKAINGALLDQFNCFGAGKRKCPGEHLGRVEMFVFLVTILQRCRLIEAAEKPLSMLGDFRMTYRAMPYGVIIEAI